MNLEKKSKISVLDIKKNHRSAAVRGGGAGCAPPPSLDPLVNQD